MGIDTNNHLGAYIKYKVKRTGTEYTATCCEKCNRSSKGKFCSGCGGRVVEIKKTKYKLEGFYQLIDRLEVGENDLRFVCSVDESDVKYDIAVSNWLDKQYPDYVDIPDYDCFVDCIGLDVQKYIENFKMNQSDFISALEKDGIEYSIGFGFMSWYS